MIRRLFFSFILLVLSSGGAVAASPGGAWVMIAGKSSLIFEGKQMGAPFRGSFSRFHPSIIFYPDNLAASAVKVEVETAGVDTQSAARDDNITGPEWFNSAQFPVARFETTSFRKTGEGHYEANANLTIQNITVPVILPFQLATKSDSEKGVYATVDAAITLDRSMFGLGGKQWADPSVIANDVIVKVHLVAQLKP